MKPDILVVDDDPLYVELVNELCSLQNVTAVSARHGMEALSILKKQHFGLIVSDVAMPVMDGLTFHAQLLKDDHLAKIPFVFITGALDDAVMAYMAQTPGIRLISKANLVNELSELLSHLQ